MIPQLIHQTWKDDRIPAGLSGYAESWPRHNPSWQRTLWTDRMLLDFVGQNYPNLLEIYCSYSNPVCRADAARYMLLHKFGGLYADIDVECMAALTPIEQETRAVLCHEPPDHWALHAPYRSQPYILFNGVMASPPGHPLWQSVLDRLPITRHATDVLDITGPCMLTGVYLGFDQKDSVIVHNCQLFSPTNKAQMECAPYGDELPTPLTKHYWAATWWHPEKRRKRLARSVTKRYHQIRHHLTKGRVLDPEETRQGVDPNVLDRPAPSGDRLAILVPVRDAAPHIDAFTDALANTDIPKALTKLVFCEGDSLDGTAEKLNAVAPALKKHYRDVVLLRKDVGGPSERDQRWHRNLQRTRRAGIAAVRNHLIDHGLDETDDWALWIDIDVWRFPADLFTRLKAANARIVAAHCVTFPGGPTFDANSFVSTGDYPRHFYYRHLRDGLFQPPPRAPGRLHLDCVRHSDRVVLDGVGGTTLLVDASLHRGGLRFPERPYKDLIETEAFGVLAGDLGIKPVGLPNVEVLHVLRTAVKN